MDTGKEKGRRESKYFYQNLVEREEEEEYLPWRPLYPPPLLARTFLSETATSLTKLTEYTFRRYFLALKRLTTTLLPENHQRGRREDGSKHNYQQVRQAGAVLLSRNSVSARRPRKWRMGATSSK
jgi:uncharacterized NAD(P)/FAD-binding protein YdhS